MLVLLHWSSVPVLLLSGGSVHSLSTSSLILLLYSLTQMFTSLNLLVAVFVDPVVLFTCPVVLLSCHLFWPLTQPGTQLFTGSVILLGEPTFSSFTSIYSLILPSRFFFSPHIHWLCSLAVEFFTEVFLFNDPVVLFTDPVVMFSGPVVLFTDPVVIFQSLCLLTQLFC